MRQKLFGPILKNALHLKFVCDSDVLCMKEVMPKINFMSYRTGPRF